jgi:hypothetical protein
VKAYLRRVVISAAALFLLMALVAPVISGSGTVPASSSCYVQAPSITSYSNQESTVQLPDANGESQLIEPTAEPEKQDDAQAEEEQSEPNSEPEVISPDMPREDEDPASPEIAYPKYNNGKSNPQGQGFLRNLLRKAW